MRRRTTRPISCEVTVIEPETCFSRGSQCVDDYCGRAYCHNFCRDQVRMTSLGLMKDMMEYLIPTECCQPSRRCSGLTGQRVRKDELHVRAMFGTKHSSPVAPSHHSVVEPATLGRPMSNPVVGISSNCSRNRGSENVLRRGWPLKATFISIPPAVLP